MRLFVAIELPDELRRAIADRVEAERGRLPAASWVRSSNLHLTLLFLGELGDSETERAMRAFADAGVGWSGAEARVERAGAFPERGPVRVVWLALEPAGELAAVAEAFRGAAREAGLRFDEKPFRPHVTLARCHRRWPAASRGELARLEPAGSPGFVPERAVLLSSALSSGGSKYTTVAGFPLGAAA